MTTVIEQSAEAIARFIRDMLFPFRRRHIYTELQDHSQGSIVHLAGAKMQRCGVLHLEGGCPTASVDVRQQPSGYSLQEKPLAGKQVFPSSRGDKVAPGNATSGVGMRHVEYLNDWDDLRVFLAVARAGSFTEAARQLGTVQSTVGRRIDKLERGLGSKLFLRHRSGMKLTSNGLTLAEYALGIQKITNQIERRLFGSDRSMVGTIRLTVTDGLAAYWLAPKIAEFQKAYPSLRLEIMAVGSFIDLSSGQADIAIRFERPADASVVSRKLGRVPFALYASPGYLKLYGTPRTVQDVSRHKIVENTNLQINMAFADWYGLLRQHASVLSANSSATVLSAVRSGAGLALLPRFFKRVSPELVQLDVPIQPVSDVWLLSHVDTNKTLRIRAALEYIARQFKIDKDYFIG